MARSVLPVVNSSRSKRAKWAVIRFGLWYFTSDEWDIRRALSMTSVSLACSPLLSNPLPLLQWKRSPCIHFPSSNRCPCVELYPPRALEQVVGHQLKKQWVKEEAEVKEKRGLYLSLVSDMALVLVEESLCETLPQPLPWLVSRYYL